MPLLLCKLDVHKSTSIVKRPHVDGSHRLTDVRSVRCIAAKLVRDSGTLSLYLGYVGGYGKSKHFPPQPHRPSTRSERGMLGKAEAWLVARCRGASEVVVAESSEHIADAVLCGDNADGQHVSEMQGTQASIAIFACLGCEGGKPARPGQDCRRPSAPSTSEKLYHGARKIAVLDIAYVTDVHGKAGEPPVAGIAELLEARQSGGEVASPRVSFRLMLE